MHLMFEWDDARYFLAIHRTKTLSEAGRRLEVNQSTVGRRLRALEEALGTTLFARTPDGYVLAPAGERLLPRAERIEEAAYAFEREASGRQAALSGTVRVTGPDAFSARVLVPLLAELCAKMPGLDVELVAENRTLSITKREADMAVRTLRPKEPSLVTRRLAELGSSLYASEAYLARRGDPRTRGGDLSGDAFVGVDDAAWSEGLWLKRAYPNARVVMKTNSTPAQLAATHAGMGIGILPCYIGDTEPGLVRVTDERVVVRHVWLALHQDLQHAGRIRACADHLTDGIVAQSAVLAGDVTTERSTRAKARAKEGDDA
jgi:DNA-binding transcriptional LysR family regulator